MCCVEVISNIPKPVEFEREKMVQIEQDVRTSSFPFLSEPTISFCTAYNTEQIAVAEEQDEEIVKLKRKQLRGVKKDI